MRFPALPLLMAAMLLGCEPASPPDPALNAKFVCEKFVRNSLKSPLTAKFPSQNEFLALPGKGKDGSDSPASLIAVTFSSGLRDPASGAKLLDKQIDFLTASEGVNLDQLTRSLHIEDARKVVRGALVRRFSRSDYVVAGYVDAQNSFGAMLRSSFICMTSRTGSDQWQSDGVALID
jgi:hypothetical protein